MYYLLLFLVVRVQSKSHICQVQRSDGHVVQRLDPTAGFRIEPEDPLVDCKFTIPFWVETPRDVSEIDFEMATRNAVQLGGETETCGAVDEVPEGLSAQSGQAFIRIHVEEGPLAGLLALTVLDDHFDVVDILGSRRDAESNN